MTRAEVCELILDLRRLKTRSPSSWRLLRQLEDARGSVADVNRPVELAVRVKHDSGAHPPGRRGARRRPRA